MRWSHTLLAIGLLLAVPALHATDADGPRATVLAFSNAVTARDPDAVLGLLANGGQQFTLRSSHAGIKAEGLTSELVKYWSTIAPVLFASTEAYSRTAEIIDSHTEGDVATVWTKTRTSSLRKGATEEVVNNFTEVYLVINTPDGWRIAAIADNRQATRLETPQASAK